MERANSKLVAASSIKDIVGACKDMCVRARVNHSRAKRRNLARKRRQELVLRRLLGLERSELLLERGVLPLQLLRRPQPEHEHLERASGS